MRKTIAPQQAWLRDEMTAYGVGDEGRMTGDEDQEADDDGPFD
jgi:hypothetical protein